MSDFKVEVVRIGKVGKHPNADSLSITHANGCPVIFRTEDFKEGNLAVHVPIDAITPPPAHECHHLFAFLGDHRRVKAKKIRGIFSMGLFVPAHREWVEGQNVQAELGIEKWEPETPATATGADDFAPSLMMPVYDIEPLRKYHEVFQHGEEVWISEKIHGCNARFVHDGNALFCGSRNRFKKDSLWNKVAERYGLAEKLAQHPGIAIYGEIYGQVQDLKYGEGDVALVVFDVLDTANRRWFDPFEMIDFATVLGLETVPTLYVGPWQGLDHAKTFAEGGSPLAGANGAGFQVREGIVVKPLRERWDATVGRVFLKLAGEGYLLRDEGKHAKPNKRTPKPIVTAGAPEAIDLTIKFGEKVEVDPASVRDHSFHHLPEGGAE